MTPSLLKDSFSISFLFKITFVVCICCQNGTNHYFIDGRVNFNFYSIKKPK